MSDHYGWTNKNSLSLSTHTRNQSLFTGCIGLFQGESGLNLVEHAGSCGERQEKTDVIFSLQKHINSDWVRIRYPQCLQLSGANEPQVGWNSCQLLTLWMSGDKGVETLSCKIRFSSVLDTFPLSPEHVDFSICSTAHSTTPTQHWIRDAGGIRELDAIKIEQMLKYQKASFIFLVTLLLDRIITFR